MAMTDRKPCIRCERPIDAQARSCPFCNWDQSQPASAQEENISTAAPYVPPDDRPWRGKLLAAVAFAALLVIAFVVGTLIHGFEPAEVRPRSKTTTPQPPQAFTPPPRSNVTLVPVEGELPQPLEQPITSAPPQAPGQQPNDATALPADQYAAAAARAKAQTEAAKKNNPLVDPRSITGAASEQSEKPREQASGSENNSDETPAPSIPRPRAARTEAFLEEKPLPHIIVDHDITARLNLTVSPSGRVTEIDVSEPIPEMPKLIQAVQNWRFRPATENGTPVTARVAVDITFRAHD
jgi:TonB family protein